ncbi:MAG: ABC transporter permease [Clostridiales bacterium]|nr:ABC transporter permease [Clostridiales bacterium]
MRRRHVPHVMASEWKKTRKTPIQLVMMLLVPLLSALFLVWAMSYVKEFTTNYEATVLLPEREQCEEMEEVLEEEYPDFSFRTGTKDDIEKILYSGHADCVIVVEEETIRIVYDSSVLSSSQALKDASDCAADLSVLLESRKMYDDLQTFYPEKEIIDLSTDFEKLNTYLDQLAGVVGMIVFLMMASNAMTIAVRSITGEKERQTFDTLVLCPVPLRRILLGKTLVLLMEVFISGVVGIGAAIGGMAIWNRRDFTTVSRIAGKNIAWLPALLLILLTATCLITAIFIVIGSAFAEAKKASLFSSAGMVLVSVSAMLPTFIENDGVKYIPIANFTPTIKAICKNEVRFDALIPALGVSAVLLGISVILASRLWERNCE